MSEVVLKNLCDGARDYILKNGSSIYLGYRESKKIDSDLIGSVIDSAIKKGLLQKVKEDEKDEGENLESVKVFINDAHLCVDRKKNISQWEIVKGDEK